jgi:hypothetical protein
LLWPDAPSAVKGQIPCNPNQPYPHIADCLKRPAAFDHAHKEILHHILGLCPTPQDGVSYTEKEP